jgi:hypothetical protein
MEVLVDISHAEVEEDTVIFEEGSSYSDFYSLEEFRQNGNGWSKSG